MPTLENLEEPMDISNDSLSVPPALPINKSEIPPVQSDEGFMQESEQTEPRSVPPKKTYSSESETEELSPPDHPPVANKLRRQKLRPSRKVTHAYNLRRRR